MRISHVTVDINTQDLNSLLEEFLPDSSVRIVDITESGIRGQVKLLLWSVDFIARPASGDDDVSLDISAYKMIPIPSALVQRSLKEAIKDAPAGVDVIRQSLRVHLPALLGPLGIDMTVRELRVYDGYLRVTVDNVQLPKLNALLAGSKAQATAGK